MTLFDIQKRVDIYEERYGKQPARMRINPRLLKKLIRRDFSIVRKVVVLGIPIVVDDAIKTIKLEGK